MNSNVKVLVVDDNEDMIFLLATELRERSFQVQTAKDGEEAIQLVNSKFMEGDRYDVILLDIKMPKVDGFQVLRIVKKNVPETKVIMLTAYSDVKNAAESIRLGASDFISKPFDLPNVLASIERCLQGEMSEARN